MAPHWMIQSNAPRGAALGAFSAVFFTRPQLKERFRLSQGAQLRSQQRWEPTTIGDADTAAKLVAGGLRDMVNASKNGLGSAIGSIIAMKYYDDGAIEMWLGRTNSFAGISQNKGVLKIYSKLVSQRLAEEGFSTSVSKM